MKNVCRQISAMLLLNQLFGCSTIIEKAGTITNNIASKGNTPSRDSSVTGTPITTKIIKAYSIPTAYETAYAYRTDTPFQNMKSIPKNIDSIRTINPDEYVKRVGEIIVSSAKNDFEKVKMAHDIVALSVKYDAKSFWAGTVPDQSYNTVLKTSLAVCEGYANTLKKFLDELKISSDIIHGYARGIGSSSLSAETSMDPNHAWNIVKINGESYLVDCTWDSGFMEGKIAKQEYSTDWLFLKPDHFIHTHYPERPNQQLLEKTLTSKQFIELPFFKPKLFEIAGSMPIGLKRINQVDNSFSFSFIQKESYALVFNVYDTKTGKKVENSTFVQNEGANQIVNFSFPSQGQYIVTIFWRKAGSKAGEDCGEFIVEAASANLIQYPTTYDSSGKGLQIIRPIEMPLKRGASYTFKVRVDNKKVVAIIHGSTFIQLIQGESGVFSIEYKIPAGINSLMIGIADSERGRYESIAKYIVK